MRNVIEYNHDEGLYYWISSTRVISVNSSWIGWEIYGTQACNINGPKNYCTARINVSLC